MLHAAVSCVRGYTAFGDESSAVTLDFLDELVRFDLAKALPKNRDVSVLAYADDLAATRCCCGLTPRTRLNAVLSANGLL